ncbi:MAG: ATP-binding cassette domain-containing protein, partial [Propionicimonas sp.]
MSALVVTGLRVAGDRELLRGIDLELAAGGALGLVGESGSGKSLTCRAVMGVLPRGLRRTGGTILIRGRAAMVFQDPLAALDPLMRAGDQVAEVVRHRDRSGRRAARDRTLGLFADVALPEPERASRAYPHELSGGQRQRVLIARALAT